MYEDELMARLKNIVVTLSFRSDLQKHHSNLIN